MRFFSRTAEEPPPEPEIIRQLKAEGAAIRQEKGLAVSIEIDHWATDQVLESLSHVESIEELTLNWCYGITDQGVSCLARLPRLVELQLHGADIDGSGLSAFADHSMLERLHLDGSSIQNGALSQVARIPNLATLFLRYTAVSDEDLPSLRSLSRLSILHLDGSLVTGAGLPVLRDLKKLEVLSLPSSIQGVDLQQLNGFGRLRWLWLGDAHVDEASVEALKSTLNPMCSVNWRKRSSGNTA